MPARRRLDASPAACAGEAALDGRRPGRQGGKQRPLQPPAHKGLHAFRLDPFGPGDIRLPAGGAVPGVVDAARGADHDQPGDGPGVAQRHVQGEPAAHGITDPGRRRTGRLHHQVRTHRQIGLDAGRLPVSGGVESDHGVPGSQRRPDGFPGPGRLGEAVDEHHGVPLSPHLPMQHHPILA